MILGSANPHAKRAVPTDSRTYKSTSTVNDVSTLTVEVLCHPLFYLFHLVFLINLFAGCFRANDRVKGRDDLRASKINVNYNQYKLTAVRVPSFRLFKCQQKHRNVCKLSYVN